MSQSRWGLVGAAAFGLVLISAGREARSQAAKPAPAGKEVAEKAPAKAVMPAYILPLSPRDQKAHEKISAALEEETQLEFIETPLAEVIDYLKDVHKIEIQFDQKALDAAGVAIDIPVTRNLKGVSLRSALGLTLKQLDLTWKIEHEVLMITSAEESYNHPEPRVYPVADLVKTTAKDGTTRSDYQPLVKLVESLTGIPHFDNSLETKPDDASVKSTKAAGDHPPAARNLKHDRDCVSASEASGSLVIVCSRETHEKVALLLGALRRARELKNVDGPKKAGEASIATPVIVARPPRELAARAKIERALESDISLDLAKTPLADACDSIADKLNIKIQLDQKALDAAGVAIDSAVSLKIHHVAGRTALERMLSPLDLTWAIQREVLLITSSEEVGGHPDLCVYPISDLGDAAPLVESLADGLPMNDWDDGYLGSIVAYNPLGVIVAEQSRENQERIAHLLAALRTARDRQGINPAEEKKQHAVRSSDGDTSKLAGPPDSIFKPVTCGSLNCKPTAQGAKPPAGAGGPD